MATLGRFRLTLNSACVNTVDMNNTPYDKTWSMVFFLFKCLSLRNSYKTSVNMFSTSPVQRYLARHLYFFRLQFNVSLLRTDSIIMMCTSMEFVPFVWVHLNLSSCSIPYAIMQTFQLHRLIIEYILCLCVHLILILLLLFSYLPSLLRLCGILHRFRCDWWKIP